MKKSYFVIYGLLILFTIFTGLISNFIPLSDWIVMLIMAITSLKFLMVTFQFMELKKANVFWKASLLLTLGLIVLLIILIKN